MRGFLSIMMVLISSSTFGQWELARINDRDGYTNVRSKPSAESEIVGTFEENQFFECQPAHNQWLKVRGYYGLSGYIHKSRITFIIDLPDSSQTKLVNDAIDGLSKYRKQYDSGNSVLLQEDRMKLLREFESFEEDVYSPLLNILKVQFCKNSDIDLLNRFISIMIENQMSANEMPSWTLGECFICHPNTVLQQIRLFDTEDKEYLLSSLEFGFENAAYSYSQKNDGQHYCPVKQKINMFIIKHPTSRIVKRRFYERWNSSVSLQCCTYEIFISNRKIPSELYLIH